jgi:hypothetical protein
MASFINNQYREKLCEKLTSRFKCDAYTSPTWRNRVKAGGEKILAALAIFACLLLFPFYALTGSNVKAYHNLCWKVYSYSQSKLKFNGGGRVCEMFDFLTEPWPCIRAGFDSLRFKYFPSVMNPTSITPEQAKKRPILLIPGAHGTPQYSYSLAKSLAKANLGPVFSLFTQDFYNLTNRDLIAVIEKIKKIRQMYQQHGLEDVKVDIVGYSRGGKISSLFAVQEKYWDTVQSDFRNIFKDRYWDKEYSPYDYDSDEEMRTVPAEWINENIGRCIQAGYPVVKYWQRRLPPAILDKLYDIVADNDEHVRKKSLLSASHQLNVNCGHIGLKYSSKVHNKIIEWLSY